MKLNTPRQWSGTLIDAYRCAESEREPVFVPTALYSDDRGWSLMNQLQGVMSPEGQINYSCVYPGVIKAWHRHRQQTDFWMCVHGNLKAGAYREEDGKAWLLVLGEQRPGVLIIPPPLWHGLATVGPQNAGIVYYVTKTYAPQAPDEERRTFDSVAEFPWGIRHG